MSKASVQQQKHEKKKNEKTRPATLAFFDKKIHKGRATFFALL